MLVVDDVVLLRLLETHDESGMDLRWESDACFARPGRTQVSAWPFTREKELVACLIVDVERIGRKVDIYLG